MKRFTELLEVFRQEYGEQNVFPNAKHLERSKPCVQAHHENMGETSGTIATRSELMKNYFDEICHADLVVIMNEKKGEEHYGTGTTIELGYAFAKGKKIHFTRKPTNANILSLMLTAKTQFS